MEKQLTNDEFGKLSETEKADYYLLSDNEKEIFAVAFRMDETEFSATTPDGATAAGESGEEKDGNRFDGNESAGTGATKTENRGRHKKDCVCEKCVAKRATNSATATNIPGEIPTPEIKTKTAGEQLEAELSEYGAPATKPGDPSPVTQSAPHAMPPVDITQFINGALFLIALDYCFPIFLKFGVGYFNPIYKRIKPEGFEKLKLTATERKHLEPSANALVQYIFAGANPIVVFLISIGAIYGGKFMMLEESDFFPRKIDLIENKERKSFSVKKHIPKKKK